MLDNYFKKQINYKFNGEVLEFDVGETLFSTFQIDHGSEVFIRSINFDSPKRILDLGCGYGFLGICLAKKFPDAEIIGLDRDLLAIRYSNHNSAKNKTGNFFAKGSIGIEAVSQEKFDLIVSNVPAKIGDKAIEEDFILAPLRLLSSNGEYWVVIVNSLNKNFIKAAAKYDLSLIFVRKRTGHIVYKMKVKG